MEEVYKDRVSTEEDEFTGKSTVYGVMYVQYGFMGMEPISVVFAKSSEGNYYAYFRAEMDDWKFFHSIGIKINDGEPEYFKETKHQREIARGSNNVEELVFFHLDRKYMEILSACERVSFRFVGDRGNVDVEMSELNFETLREFLTITQDTTEP